MFNNNSFNKIIERVINKLIQQIKKMILNITYFFVLVIFFQHLILLIFLSN